MRFGDFASCWYFYQLLIPNLANKILDQLTLPLDERDFAHLESLSLASGSIMDAPHIVLLSRFEFPLGIALDQITWNCAKGNALKSNNYRHRQFENGPKTDYKPEEE